MTAQETKIYAQQAQHRAQYEQYLGSLLESATRRIEELEAQIQQLQKTNGVKVKEDG